ncbi:MAG TPA: hypothetical protein VNB54_11300 [Alphaproteobacteria bacterium]|nr:hypothetical protein [Alphaproteobacteria bacterium]
MGITYKTAWKLRREILRVVTTQGNYPWQRQENPENPVDLQAVDQVRLDALAERFRSSLPIFMQKLVAQRAKAKVVF